MEFIETVSYLHEKFRFSYGEKNVTKQKLNKNGSTLHKESTES